MPWRFQSRRILENFSNFIKTSFPIAPTQCPGSARKFGVGCRPIVFKKLQVVPGGLAISPFEFGLNQVEPIFRITRSQLQGALQVKPRFGLAADTREDGRVAI